LDKMEKRKEKRRVSHNLVERRRRDNINAQIQELATLLPAMYLEAAVAPSGLYSSSMRSTGDPDSGLGSPSGTPLSAGLASPPMHGHYSFSSKASAGSNKPNKGIVLSKSVDYIRHLLEIVEAQNARNRHLAAVVQSLGGTAGPMGNEDDLLLNAAMTGTPPDQVSVGAVAPEFLAAFAQHMAPSSARGKTLISPPLSRENSGGTEDADGDDADIEDDRMEA